MDEQLWDENGFQMVDLATLVAAQLWSIGDWLRSKVSSGPLRIVAWQEAGSMGKEAG